MRLPFAAIAFAACALAAAGCGDDDSDDSAGDGGNGNAGGSGGLDGGGGGETEDEGAETEDSGAQSTGGATRLRLAANPAGELAFDKTSLRAKPGPCRDRLRQPGEYKFYCPVGNHEQAGMVGTLTVR